MAIKDLYQKWKTYRANKAQEEEKRKEAWKSFVERDKTNPSWKHAPEEEDEKVKAEYKKNVKDKNKKRSILDRLAYTKKDEKWLKKTWRRKIITALDKKLPPEITNETNLGLSTGKKYLKHNDPDVKALETKHPIRDHRLFDAYRMRKNQSMFLYEPYTRYERIENPDYKRYKSYSSAGILTGTGLLALGLASFNYSLAYAGAALTIASLGYRSGQWWRNKKVDIGFEKVPSELEKKIIQEIHDNPDSISSDYRDVGYRARIAAKKAGIKETDKDKELYVKKIYRVEGHAFPHYSPCFYYSSIHHAPRESSNTSWIGGLGIGLTSLLAFLALTAPNEIPSAAGPLLYAAGSTALATLSHYVGYIFSKKTAPAEYRKVGNLENKVKTMQGMDGSEAPEQPEDEDYGLGAPLDYKKTTG